MDLDQILKLIALVGAVIVGVTALVALRAEWKKTELEDQITKIMMVLLTVGCIFVVLVAFGVWGKV
jgi:adenine/guanine phosphoribosyltransferase-like PRPP-binding protein